MNRHVAKAISAAERVEHHRGQMGRYARIRAENVRRAVEDDSMSVGDVAERLGVSVSAVRKAVALARNPDDGRQRWQGRATDDA